MSTVIDRMTEQQERFIELLTSWQKPVVSFVGRSVAMANERASSLNFPVAERLADRMPKVELPKAAQLIETQFGFAAKLLDTNKKFALDLADAFDGEAAAPKAKPAAPTSKPAAKAAAPRAKAAAARPKPSAE